VNTALVVAIIAGVVALISAAFSGWTQLHVAKRERQSKAKEVLDRCRGPLLDAAWLLGDRLDNIRHRRFFDYLREDSGREEDAKLTTLSASPITLAGASTSALKSSCCGSRTRRTQGGSLGSSMTSHGCLPVTR
jgi:hypothetical protein